MERDMNYPEIRTGSIRQSVNLNSIFQQVLSESSEITPGNGVIIRLDSLPVMGVDVEMIKELFRKILQLTCNCNRGKSLLHVKSEFFRTEKERSHVLVFHSNLAEGVNGTLSEDVLNECAELCERSGGKFVFSRTGNSGVFRVQLPEKLN